MLDLRFVRMIFPLLNILFFDFHKSLKYKFCNGTYTIIYLKCPFSGPPIATTLLKPLRNGQEARSRTADQRDVPAETGNTRSHRTYHITPEKPQNISPGRGTRQKNTQEASMDLWIERLPIHRHLNRNDGANTRGNSSRYHVIGQESS